ncbi:hypothetical protein KR032_002981, partial [Drosophila birchii]
VSKDHNGQSGRMQSELVPFYKNKTVFVTGATGFLGKVITEKLLRSTDVKRIYCLMRPKKGESVEGRFAEWKKNGLFEVLLESKPRAFELVTPIAGDCCAPGLGLAEEDRRTLVTQVQVVFHGAASVNFVEPLHKALIINTRAVRLMVQLAREMRCLESFVHISTAYSNCVVDTIHERFYPEHLSCPADKLLELNETLSAGLINKMSNAFLGKYPNTYTFTKALGEQVIQEEAGDLPIGIVRPGIVINSYKEPSPGWIEGMQGCISMIYGIAYGVLRIMWVNMKSDFSGVPVDYCANVALATGWQLARKDYADQAQNKVPPIYSLCVRQSNSCSLTESFAMTEARHTEIPNTKMMWYPLLHSTSCPWLFSIGTYFYHLLPGFFLDLVLRLKGKKPIMLKIYKKIHESVHILSPFCTRKFIFDSTNTEQLWRSMTSEDQRIFDFDMGSVNWPEFLKVVLEGIRLHIFKIPLTPESIATGKRMLSR